MPRNKAEGEWLEVACMGEVLTLGILRSGSGGSFLTLAGWGQGAEADAAFERIAELLDTKATFKEPEAAKRSAEATLDAAGVRDRGVWRGKETNRSGQVDCAACGRKVDRWRTEAAAWPKARTGIGFFCRDYKTRVRGCETAPADPAQQEGRRNA